MRFCLCIFESDTVKIEYHVQIFRKNMKYLKTVGVYLTSFTVFLLEIFKKKALKKSSENDQSTGHFSFFLLFLFVPSTLNLKNIHVNQLMEKVKKWNSKLLGRSKYNTCILFMFLRTTRKNSSLYTVMSAKSDSDDMFCSQNY